MALRSDSSLTRDISFALRLAPTAENLLGFNVGYWNGESWNHGIGWRCAD